MWGVSGDTCRVQCVVLRVSDLGDSFSLVNPIQIVSASPKLCWTSVCLSVYIHAD